MDRNTQKDEREARWLRRANAREEWEGRQQAEEDIRNIRSQREELLSDRITDNINTMGERHRQLMESVDKTLRESERQESDRVRDSNEQRYDTAGRMDDNISVNSRDSVFTSGQSIDIDYELSRIEDRFDQNTQRLNTVDVDRKRLGALTGSQGSENQEAGNRTHSINGDGRCSDRNVSDQGMMANSQQVAMRTADGHTTTNQTSREVSADEGERSFYSQHSSSRNREMAPAASEKGIDRSFIKDNTERQSRNQVSNETATSVEDMERRLDREIGNLDEYLRKLDTGEYDMQMHSVTPCDRRSVSKAPDYAPHVNKESNCPQDSQDMLDKRIDATKHQDRFRDYKGSVHNIPYPKEGQSEYESEGMSNTSGEENRKRKLTSDMDIKKLERNIPKEELQTGRIPTSRVNDQSTPTYQRESNYSNEGEYKSGETSQTTLKQGYFEREFEERKAIE